MFFNDNLPSFRIRLRGSNSSFQLLDQPMLQLQMARTPLIRLIPSRASSRPTILTVLISIMRSVIVILLGLFKLTMPDISRTSMQSTLAMAKQKLGLRHSLLSYETSSHKDNSSSRMLVRIPIPNPKNWFSYTDY